MTKPKRIFIIGHMGAGKFIFTEALAKKLEWQLVDANPSIERYIGRQTRDILGEQGEAAFNRCQADIISHCIGKENVVVLLEECVVSSEECRNLLSSEFVIYLKVSIPTQLGRMRNGRVPSLPADDMKSFLEKQHDERDDFYEQSATLIIESAGYPEQTSEINKIVEEDLSKVMEAFENQPKLTENFNTMMQWDKSAPERLSHCKMPMLYIEDGGGCYSDLKQLQSICPQLAVAKVVGSGHFPTIEVPEQVNAMLYQFFDIIK